MSGTRDAYLSRRGFRWLAALTVAATFLTILLGVSTKATGAGLACQARWPVCDGGFLNLFPQSVPSFFEMIHRVVAGVTGLFILATAAVAWLDDHARYVKLAATAAVVLLPVQVLLGRQTVLEFTGPILFLHYWVAMGIFAGVVVATTLVYRDVVSAGAYRRALAVAAVAQPLVVLFGAQVLSRYTPPVQTAHYAVSLTVLAALAFAVVGGWGVLDARARWLAAAALGAFPVQIALGRVAVGGASGALLTAHAAVIGLVFALAVAAALVAYRVGPAARATAA
ncbi:cytochrome oxidase assembly protein [Halorubellus sp. JP-L1]|uniref:COX15/CtaA family protein n=1 Tax=Halorubellus sp. JP-L1 TaxID=2715753 RepID=UPI00140D88DE|nr:COX15/CtaA family protein [Halorubellus sp. JP-L1]NHN41179.1 cytochrome oxidase assembly protein [Halorubellus sp. JP-L1]